MHHIHTYLIPQGAELATQYVQAVVNCAVWTAGVLSTVLKIAGGVVPTYVYIPFLFFSL